MIAFVVYNDEEILCQDLTEDQVDYIAHVLNSHEKYVTICALSILMAEFLSQYYKDNICKNSIPKKKTIDAYNKLIEHAKSLLSAEAAFEVKK